MGKGSRPRPYSVSQSEFGSNWDAIFKRDKTIDYHAHVYWNSNEQKEQALTIRGMLPNLGCLVGRAHDEPIGPHPLPMFQAIYNSKNKDSVESAIENMRGDLSVLLHEAINDDVRDHTEGARWLGTPLKLDLVWLEHYVKNQVNRT